MPGRSPASRPDRNRERAEEFLLKRFPIVLVLVLEQLESRTRTRTRRNQRQSRPSAFGFQFSLRTSYFSLQIMACPEMHAAEDAFADFDFEFAEVGDGLEFLEHSRRQGKRRRHFAV